MHAHTRLTDDGVRGRHVPPVLAGQALPDPTDDERPHHPVRVHEGVVLFQLWVDGCTDGRLVGWSAQVIDGLVIDPWHAYTQPPHTHTPQSTHTHPSPL